MNQLNIRGTKIELPNLPEGGELDAVDSLDTRGGTISDFQYTNTELRGLELKSGTLRNGKIHALQTAQTSFTDLRLHSVELLNCNLSSLEWSGGQLSRVRLKNCSILGAQFHDVKLEHAIFDHCKLDYTTFSQLRATGPVIFNGCSLREAQFSRCDLATVLFDDCKLTLTEFDHGAYRAADLRGNDLSEIRGVSNLKNAIIDGTQMLQLAEALAVELNLVIQ